MKIILDSIQHIELKRQINEVLGQGEIVEIGKINGYGAYLKIDDSLSVVSVYCKINLDYDKEDVYFLWGNIVSNCFYIDRGWKQFEKSQTSKNFLIKKTTENHQWGEIHPKLKAFFLDAIKKMPSNNGSINKDEVANVIFKHRNEIPPSTVGEAHFYIVQGKELLKDSRIKNLTFEIDPNKRYLQGASHTRSVKVDIHFQEQKIATRMYKFAEESTGLKIVPAAVLSPDGEMLHKYLGNIK